MKKKAWILTIFILFLIMIKCDVFEPEKKTGSLQIVLVKDENGLQKSATNLSSVQCILKKGSNEIYNDYLTLRASSFYAEIKDLEPSNDYKVLLYGRNSDSDILARGFETGVSVRAGEQTTVNMMWSPFFPVLNSPENGSTVNSVAVTFDWNDVEGAVIYHLMAAISNKFNVPLINKDTISVSHYTFPSDLREADVLNRDYYWKVRSKDSQGNWGAWSDTWSFTVSTASTTIEWVTVAGGTFQMGDTFGDGYSNELPVHNVTLSTFQIGKYVVTNAQYAAFLNAYGSSTVQSGDYAGQTMIYEHVWGVQESGGNWQAAPGYENYPVVYVTWYGSYEFCRYYGYRLPTEAEWEYTAKGGNQSQGYKYSGSNSVDEVAWYSDNSDGHSHQVGTKNPNELGIYDMSGNVYEWCWDWYDENYYSSSPGTNPQGPSSGWIRVIRGGSWGNDGWNCRCTDRNTSNPVTKGYNVGFRCARTP